MVSHTDRAQLVGDPHLANPTAAMWFNTAAFAQNRVVTGVATEGNSARNLLYGPGYRVVDLALTRDIRLGERYKVSLRAEGTNVFNIVNLGQPGAAVPAAGSTSATFGVITSAASMRKLNLARVLPSDTVLRNLIRGQSPRLGLPANDSSDSCVG